MRRVSRVGGRIFCVFWWNLGMRIFHVFRKVRFRRVKRDKVVGSGASQLHYPWEWGGSRNGPGQGSREGLNSPQVFPLWFTQTNGRIQRQIVKIAILHSLSTLSLNVPWVMSCQVLLSNILYLFHLEWPRREINRSFLMPRVFMLCIYPDLQSFNVR